MTRYAIAVGANRGDRSANIMRAAELLQADGDVRVEHRSRLMETAPMGGPPGQGAYLNGAWIVATDLGPHQLLHRLQGIEHAVGRTRTISNGPRTIDLDLLLAEDGSVCRSTVLELPHPRLHLRRFVLEPLAEIAGDWRHPHFSRSIRELLTMSQQIHLPDHVAVRAAGERIAGRVARGSDDGHPYTRDLAFEAVLGLAAVTGDARWRMVVADEVARRGWTPGFHVPWRSEPFCSLSWAWIQETSDSKATQVFATEAADMRRTLERTSDGLITHPRGAARGGGVAVLLDSFQEYISRVARAGAAAGDASFFADCADQALRHRALLRESTTGLWCQGRGWLGDQPNRLSPGTWSRGQGWLLRGLMAATHAIPIAAPEHSTMKAIFVEAVAAACVVQQPSGMWHALPHRPPRESAPEASGTGLIAATILDGVRTGLLPAEPYRAHALRAVAALLSCVDAEGVVHAACPGPGPLQDETPWRAPAFTPGDPHGPGCVLAALVAYLR